MYRSKHVKAGAALGLVLTAMTVPAIAGGDVDYGNGVVLRGTKAAVPVPVPVPIPDESSRFYLRLDAAASFNSAKRYTDSYPIVEDIRNDDGLQTFGRFGVGVGYQFSPWFRGDITFDGRSSTRSTASRSHDYSGPTDNTTNPGPHVIAMRDTQTDQFRTKDYTALANAYLDIPINSNFTPYVGVGLGVVLHNTEGRTITNATTCVDVLNCDPKAGNRFVPLIYDSSGNVTGVGPTLLYPNDPGFKGLNVGQKGSSGHQYSAQMAAALMGGLSYKLSANGMVDVGYRWLHLGGTSFNTTILGTATSPTVISKITIPDQNIQELRVGYRLNIN